MKKLIAMFLLSMSCFAATVTHRDGLADTSNTTTYGPTLGFTPAAGDLIVVFVTASGTVAAGTVTDSQGLGFTKITSVLKNTNADTIYMFVSNALATAAGDDVTFDCTGDAATAVVIQVFSVSGMTKTGATAVLQTAVQANQAAAGTPAPAFASAAQTGNPTVGVVGNGTNPAGMTPPTNWTERNDTGVGTPTTGAEYVSRDSGFTGTTITWGSTSASAFGDIIAELDTSGGGGPTCHNSLTLLGAGCN
jgi:hypothetical protein